MKLKHTREKENKENINISDEILEYIPNLSYKNQEQSISEEAISTHEDYFPAKHVVNNEDLNIMIKNFIRLSFSLEHKRAPIKREDITKKVLLPSYSRSFPFVFEKTQEKLRNIFGMELIELPYKDRYKYMSASQLRKNKCSQIQNSSSIVQSNKSWMLCSILDSKYSELIYHIPTMKECTFSGIIMIILSIVIMNGGMISEELLIKYLSDLHINNDTSIGSLDKTLKEIVKKGYLEKIKDEITSINKTENYTYFLGPRGKIEIDQERLAAFIGKIQNDTSQNFKEIIEKLYNKNISNEH
ncbi:hypothetical protein PORY_000223 [Pneumocystis oryctolagi]|uniref:Uncharacterized protein n=1 Tax=Pneumocystis oryctolagi TaxID=42067 RepID=A0ACB7CGF5_9ASCO|nr:hypothetical protein PORY_000223 [Pneumocystis oryctolagi]